MSDTASGGFQSRGINRATLRSGNNYLRFHVQLRTGFTEPCKKAKRERVAMRTTDAVALPFNATAPAIGSGRIE
jgi:hypothetical protein